MVTGLQLLTQAPEYAFAAGGRRSQFTSVKKQDATKGQRNGVLYHNYRFSRWLILDSVLTLDVCDCDRYCMAEAFRVTMWVAVDFRSLLAARR